MTTHSKFPEIETLVDAGISVLLTGEKGSGKTTLAKQVAEKLGLKFYSMSMTRQTTLSHLLGFISVNGTYVPSQLRSAAEEGGAFLLDEIDASDANVLLSLNTAENGYIAFPDGIVELHEDFRLMATANPQDQHEFYTGRTKLDAATLDRFDIVEIPRDENLERSLVDAETYRIISAMREVLGRNNSSIVVSMRDSMRYQRRKDLGIINGFIPRLVDKNQLILDQFNELLETMPKHSDQGECQTFEELIDLANVQAKREETS
jgi:MoxR-like ATPase